MDVHHAVTVVEVGPRDGLQNEAAVLDTATKVELVRRVLAAGARRVEAVSFVHPRLVPQMADAEAVMAALRAPGFLRGADVARPASVAFIGLVLNERGLDRALDAGVDEVNVVVPASDTFSRRNQGMPQEAMLDVAGVIAERARGAGMPCSAVVSTAFGCPFEGEIDVEAVLAVVDRCVRAGYPEVALADTIGVGVPAQVRALVRGVDVVAADAGRTVRQRAHFHNTRNTGYANALAAVESGVTVLDASVGGIGGCPFAPNATGNIATEDLTYLLERSGRRTGLDVDLLAATGTWVAAQLGRQAPALLGRAGPFPAGRGD
jgi:hydroxymethylglutaryl-CoA lyase